MSPPPSSRGAIGRERSARLLTEPVGPTLIRLALPMVVGLAAIILFTVVDTFFVGRLGATPLAAMSFCFPVNFVVYSVTMGIGIGTTSVISRAIGEGDQARVRRLTTHALVLALGTVTLIAGIGLVTMDPIFSAMGADATTLPLIREYMTPWLWGVGLLVIPMVGNSAIRATGDTVSPDGTEDVLPWENFGAKKWSDDLCTTASFHPKRPLVNTRVYPLFVLSKTPKHNQLLLQLGATPLVASGPKCHNIVPRAGNRYHGIARDHTSPMHPLPTRGTSGVHVDSPSKAAGHQE